MEFWTDLGVMTNDPTASKIVGQWGISPMPKGPGAKGKVTASLNAGWAIGLSQGSKDKELAYAFLEYAARPDIQLRYNTVVGGIDPVRKSTLNDPAYIKFVSPQVADAIKGAHATGAMAWPNTELWFKLQEPLTDNLSLALTGDKNPKQALDDTQAAWLKIIAQE
jgi:ABC-type glycerol-3-phosphate transport system substrate-binding protein